MRFVFSFLIFITAIHSLHAQKLNDYHSSVFIFKIDESSDDSCLCDSAEGMYYYVDNLGKIHWIENQNFCTRNFIRDYDTIVKKDEILYRPSQVLVPHKVEAVFSIVKSANSINVIASTPGNNLTSNFSFCRLDKSTVVNRRGLISGIEDSARSYQVKLLDNDTVITFNGLKFHCYKIQEKQNDIGGYIVESFYIDKRSLLPVYRETIITETLNRPPDLFKTKKHRYFLLGIMKINEQFLPKIKIWQNTSSF